ncbi:MAG TPA: histidine--tRNA ligase [Bacteroidia bacterium]|nr:histidine--tRNA ligase [Bacteroidia bacterium]HNT79463.1 histidine--tRNA ligase [Bacteroidia bacterium]
MANIPKGTRDFLPFEMVRRSYIFDTIRNVFIHHGYLPIETPAIELTETLTGKYGDEGDKLIFRILNSGDYLKKLPPNFELNEQAHKEMLPFISEKALRYDLTVPFARFVSKHRNEINFPFKRYQIQPVWRADNPQKGRYREFYQCDVDVIGSNSLLNELDLMIMVRAVFAQLNLPVCLKYNNRKILSAIAEKLLIENLFTEFTIALDKIEKVGKEKVLGELQHRGFTAQQLEQLNPVFNLSGSTKEKLEWLETFLSESEIGKVGIAEAKELNALFQKYNDSNCELVFDLTLARGLNYYTGSIFEVKSSIGNFNSSICGGGRYDDLTGIFGMPNVSGVGISFGADRIYDVLLENNLFPNQLNSSVKALIINFGTEEIAHALDLLNVLYDHNISCELYPDDTKIKKQIDYAMKKNIPYVIIAGKEEIKSGTYNLKDIVSGIQQTYSLNELINTLK